MSPVTGPVKTHPAVQRLLDRIADAPLPTRLMSTRHHLRGLRRAIAAGQTERAREIARFITRRIAAIRAAEEEK